MNQKAENDIDDESIKMLEEQNQISPGLCNSYINKKKEYETDIQNLFNKNNTLKQEQIFKPFSELNNESTCWKSNSVLKLTPQTCFGKPFLQQTSTNDPKNHSKQLNNSVIKYSPFTINRIIKVLIEVNVLEKSDATNEEKEKTVQKKCNDLALLNLIKNTNTLCIMFNSEENQQQIKKGEPTENGECHEVKTKDENNNQDSTKTKDEKAQCEIDESIKIKLEEYVHIKPGLCNTYFYKKVDEYETYIQTELNKNNIVKQGDIFQPFSELNDKSECKKINVIQNLTPPQTCFGNKLFKQWNSGRPNSKQLKNSIISQSPNTINRIINKLVEGNVLDAKWNAANETISNEVKEETVQKKCNDLALLNQIKKTSNYCLEQDCKEGQLVKLLENSMKKRENGECYTDSNSIKNQAGQ